MTTMSTIGFGDFYPISNEERLLGSFMLLFGVALFSVFMGLLLEMIQKINSLDSNCSEEASELDKFFVWISMFNRGYPINKEISDDITEFMKYHWQKNKNNFIICDDDKQLFD